MLIRIWDVMFRDGQEFLFRAALGILSMYQVRTMISIQGADDKLGQTHRKHLK
jgi:hypothetical protein